MTSKQHIQPFATGSFVVAQFLSSQKSFVVFSIVF